jgi:hypothetical protein
MKIFKAVVVSLTLGFGSGLIVGLEVAPVGVLEQLEEDLDRFEEEIQMELHVHSTDEEDVVLTDLEYAIWMVESSGRTEAEDGGPILGDWCAHSGTFLSRGPLQISYAAWYDACMFDESLCARPYEDVDDINYAVKVFRSYCARYATPHRLDGMDVNQGCARMWNGGPTGHRKQSTVGYWSKVAEQLRIVWHNRGPGLMS